MSALRTRGVRAIRNMQRLFTLRCNTTPDALTRRECHRAGSQVGTFAYRRAFGALGTKEDSGRAALSDEKREALPGAAGHAIIFLSPASMARKLASSRWTYPSRGTHAGASPQTPPARMNATNSATSSGAAGGEGLFVSVMGGSVRIRWFVAVRGSTVTSMYDGRELGSAASNWPTESAS